MCAKTAAASSARCAPSVPAAPPPWSLTRVREGLEPAASRYALAPLARRDRASGANTPRLRRRSRHRRRPRQQAVGRPEQDVRVTGGLRMPASRRPADRRPAELSAVQDEFHLRDDRVPLLAELDESI